jgi:hypothetical protein
MLIRHSKPTNLFVRNGEERDFVVVLFVVRCKTFKETILASECMVWVLYPVLQIDSRIIELGQHEGECVKARPVRVFKERKNN